VTIEEIARLIPGYDPWDLAGDCQFDTDKAKDALAFISECLKFTEGEKAGQPFELEPWQAAVVVNLYGWYRPDGTRRYREAFIYVPRKNGKTSLLSCLVLHEMFCIGEPGAQLYSAAAEREQAALLFRHACEMIRQEEELEVRCVIKPSMKVIERTDGAWSMFKALSAESATKHGLSPSFVVIDELHAHPNGELVDVLTTGTGSRKQPLVVYITTADFNRKSVCNDKYEYACKVRDNGGSEHKEGYDQALLPVIYEAHIDDDWTDPEVWKKANPNFGVSVREDYISRECQKARELPAYENTFRRLHLNQRTQQDVRAIPMDQWDNCGQGAKPLEWRERMIQVLARHSCFGGLDLGSVSDLTAFALVFGDYELGYDVLPFFWCPEATAAKRSRRDGVDYVQWANAGYITLTEGNETDYQKVRRDINQLAIQFGIQKIAADRLFQGAQLCQDLIADGMDVLAMGQGYVDMAAPTRSMLDLVSGGRLRHGNNPVLRWMAANAATESQSGPAEAVLKFSRKKSTEKIDGIIATCQALGIAILNPSYAFDPGSLAL
jgi:phage terminase large subunit-like protein